MSSIKTKIDQSNEIVDKIEGVADKVESASKAISSIAVDKSILFNNTKPAFSASALVASNVDAKLKKLIRSLDDDFNSFVLATARYLSDNYAIKLTKKDLGIISRKGSSLIDSLVDNNDVLKRDVQNILTQNLAKGVPERELIKSLKDLYPAYASNAKTIVNTGLQRLHNDINVTKFQDEGFQWYIWAGPNDKLTREAPCRHWVWHRFPETQLSQVSAIKMRLWNCRHSIIPIREEDIENYPILDMKYA